MLPLTASMVYVYVHIYTTRYPSGTHFPFSFGVSLSKPNSRKKGTLIIQWFLGNLDKNLVLRCTVKFRVRIEGSGLRV